MEDTSFGPGATFNVVIASPNGLQLAAARSAARVDADYSVDAGDVQIGGSLVASEDDLARAIDAAFVAARSAFYAAL